MANKPFNWPPQPHRSSVERVQTRDRTEGSCPRCGADLIVTEEGVETAEHGVVAWAMVRRRCSAGCLLTVDDFA